MNSQTTALPTCRLCGLPIRGHTDGFCCPGCRHVFEILREMTGSAEAEAMQGHEFFRRMQAAGIVPREGPPRFEEDHGREGDDGRDCEPPAPPDETTDRRVFRVEGMWCPSCSWVIERILRKEEGVLWATASFASDRVRVTYLPRLVGPGRIAQAIEDLGYRVVPSDAEQRHERQLRSELLRLGLSVFLTVNIMMLSFGIYQGYIFEGFFLEVTGSAVRMIGVPALLMSTIVVFWGGFPILERAVRAARARAFVMETLIGFGAVAAYGLSLYGLLHGSLHLYFDTAAMLITLVLLGKYLESRIRTRATRGIEEIYGLLPGKARLRTGEGDRYVSIGAVEPGALVRVVEGEPIPVDGVIVAGRGTVDESKLTGESELRAKGEGDTVLGAGRLVSGEVTVRATGVGESSAIGRMITLMEEAMVAKNPAERLADRIMAVFAPAVIALAVSTGLALALLGRPVESALVRAITVLVIACPCALGIAIPLARVAAVGRARRSGILVVNAEALEKANRLTAVVIDKTGTATHGEYEALDVEALGASPEEVLTVAAALEAGSDHPVALAVRASRHGPGQTGATDITIAPGRGVRGVVDGRKALVGSLAFMEEHGIEVSPTWSGAAELCSSRGETVVFVVWDGSARGMIRLGDSLREDMAATVAGLKARGVEVHLVSGDTPATTAFVAGELGIDRFEGGVLPADKVERIRALQSAGHTVAMVGDGANDAAALAAADVGFATGEALTVTKNASDMTLLSFSGTRLIEAIGLSEIAVRTIGTNLALALGYNVIALPLAVAGVVNPIIAVSLMLISSLTVVANSARIARPKGSTCHPEERSDEGSVP